MSERATPDELTAAANLLREHGYAVVYKREHDLWSRWLEEGQENTREMYDREQQLLWAYSSLLADATRHCAPSRPRWLRDARSWWHNHRWTEPVMFGGSKG